MTLKEEQTALCSWHNGVQPFRGFVATPLQGLLQPQGRPLQSHFYPPAQSEAMRAALLLLRVVSKDTTCGVLGVSAGTHTALLITLRPYILHIATQFGISEEAVPLPLFH